MAYAYAHGGVPPYQPIISNNKIWFDGYAGQPVIFFDEFEGQAPYHALKTICDEYDDLVVEVKGSTTPTTIKCVIINTNKPIGTWWAGETDLDPLRRRVRSHGCYAIWGGSADDYEDASRIYPPTEYKIGWKKDTFTWRSYPDPPGSDLTISDTEGTCTPIVITVNVGAGLEVDR